MKSAYELSMERLERECPRSGKRLTDDQKRRLPEIENEYQAKIARRRIMNGTRVEKLRMQGRFCIAAIYRGFVRGRRSMLRFTQRSVRRGS